MEVKIAFIGGGNMASALIGGLLKDGWSHCKIVVIEPNEHARENLLKLHKIAAISEAGTSLTGIDVVLWAVKPQVLAQVARELSGQLRDALHISIAAGVRAADLSRWLGSRRVVRAMPNTPALVSAGVTGLFAEDAVTGADKALTNRLLSSSGQVFWVESDERIDAITAVSGSGPAYVFHFLEGLQSAAEKIGFSTEQARDLALLTAEGAVKQARSERASLAELREKVRSKGGTTDAALNVLDQQKTQAALSIAVSAAYDRAVEMATDFGKD